MQFELRGRKVSYDLEKEKLRRMQETMKKRKAKWVKSGYFSSAIRLEFLQPPVQQDAEKELMEDDEDASTQKLEDEDVEAAPEKPWTCQACTFVNEDLTADKCAICEAPREPSKTTAKEEVDRMEEDTTPVEAKEKGKEKEAEGTRPEEPEPEIDEDADIHFVVGDVTRPYEHIESAKAAIIGIFTFAKRNTNHVTYQDHAVITAETGEPGDSSRHLMLCLRRHSRCIFKLDRTRT